VSNRRQYKRHVRNQWTHGQASRAVDGDLQPSLHSCTLLDNFYVDKPVWMVDLATQTVVSGVVIVTWQSPEQPDNGITFNLSPRRLLTTLCGPGNAVGLPCVCLCLDATFEHSNITYSFNTGCQTQPSFNVDIWHHGRLDPN